MRRPNLDKIQIVEPPIGELSKNRSTFKRTCLSGCGCVILFFVGAIVAVWFIIGPGPKTINTVPTNFPKDIPLYDQDSISRITFISGKYKSRGMEVAAIFPKIILSPLLLRTTPEETSASAPGAASRTMSLKRMWKLITAPVGDNRDSVQVEWGKMSAGPEFVIGYYKQELRKGGYIMEDQSDGKTQKIIFTNLDGIDGTLFAAGDERRRSGTDYAVLTVNLATTTSR